MSERFDYFEFYVVIDKRFPKHGIFICYKKLSAQPIPNGVKFWKEEDETLLDFIKKVKREIRWLRQWPR